MSALDEKLGQLAQQAAADNAGKALYDKQYQVNVAEVQAKQKEPPPKPPAPRPPNPLKSGPTAAGLALLARKEKEEAERKAERERIAQGGDSNMDVDDEKGKGRR